MYPVAYALFFLHCAGVLAGVFGCSAPSGNERASMDVRRDTIERQGIDWRVDSVAGSGRFGYTDVRAAWVRAGQVPTAAQMISD